MNHTRKTRNICFIPLVLCLLLFITDSCINFHANRNTIQYSDIEQIRIGMPLDSVVLILGQPYTFECDLGCHDLTCKHPRIVSDIKMTKETSIPHIIDSIYHDTNYCCETNREMMKTLERNTMLTYTKRPCFIMSILKSYPMLWVHLDSVYRVSSVYAKYYDADDKCIYSLSSNKIIHDDESRDDSIKLYEDTTLFRMCFPTFK